MFIILKPDADLRRWLKILSSFKIKEIYFRQKDEAWVREHYSHIPESAIPRNVDLFESGESIGIELDVDQRIFKHVRHYLRSKRIIGEHIERNQIHVPDLPTVSKKEKELFLETKSS